MAIKIKYNKQKNDIQLPVKVEKPVIQIKKEVIVPAKIEKSNNKKIALCFTVTKPLHHQNLWKKWINFDLFDVYAHCDKDVNLGWLEQFRISDRIWTKWGRLLKAQLNLFRKANQTNKHDFFCLASESCIPLHAPKVIYNTINHYNKSIMSVHDHPRRYQGRNIFGVNKESALYSTFKKHSQWITLTKKHLQILLSDNIYSWAIDGSLVDQVYPGTVLYNFGELGQILNNDQTFTYWNRARSGSGSHPVTFNEIGEWDYKYIKDKRETCLFARKFTKQCNLDKIIKDFQLISNKDYILKLKNYDSKIQKT